MKKYGILRDPDIGQCPSCKEQMALTRLTELDALLRCPKCHAMSYGYKWLADKGKSAAERTRKLYEELG